MTATHWIRKRIISDTEVDVIRYELQHIKQNMISTPDGEASYAKILETLERLKPA